MSTERIDVEALRGHTPGPWEAEGYSDSEEGCAVLAVIRENGRPLPTPTRGMVAWLTTSAGASFRSSEVCESNSRLIAAAPALLAEVIERRARDAAVVEIVAAVKDARESMAEGYGVDWQRIDAALDAIQGARP